MPQFRVEVFSVAKDKSSCQNHQKSHPGKKNVVFDLGRVGNEKSLNFQAPAW